MPEQMGNGARKVFEITGLELRAFTDRGHHAWIGDEPLAEIVYLMVKETDRAEALLRESLQAQRDIADRVERNLDAGRCHTDGLLSYPAAYLSQHAGALEVALRQLDIAAQKLAAKRQS